MRARALATDYDSGLDHSAEGIGRNPPIQPAQTSDSQIPPLKDLILIWREAQISPLIRVLGSSNIVPGCEDADGLQEWELYRDGGGEDLFNVRKDRLARRMQEDKIVDVIRARQCAVDTLWFRPTGVSEICTLVAMLPLAGVAGMYLRRINPGISLDLSLLSVAWLKATD